MTEPHSSRAVAATIAADQAMTRRKALLFTGAAAAAATLATGKARAADEHDMHKGHDMSGHGKAKNKALVDAALACVGRGEVCAEHCIGMLSMGDTSLKDCLRSVQTMLPMCLALARLGALDAKRLKEFAKVCRDVCADCEEECKKHSEKHELCKACADSCADCIKECKAVIGA